jgi:hypothetical protein
MHVQVDESGADDAPFDLDHAGAGSSLAASAPRATTLPSWTSRSAISSKLFAGSMTHHP